MRDPKDHTCSPRQFIVCGCDRKLKRVFINEWNLTGSHSWRRRSQDQNHLAVAFLLYHLWRKVEESGARQCVLWGRLPNEYPHTFICKAEKDKKADRARAPIFWFNPTLARARARTTVRGLELEQALTLHLPNGWRRPKCLSYHLLPPRVHIRRQVDQK